MGPDIEATHKQQEHENAKKSETGVITRTPAQKALVGQRECKLREQTKER